MVQVSTPQCGARSATEAVAGWSSQRVKISASVKRLEEGEEEGLPEFKAGTFKIDWG